MVKNIALFLASSTLACVLPASTITAPPMGGYEVLMSERSVGGAEYAFDGYNFFGDCIVEATINYKVDNLVEGTIDFDNVSRVSFGNWNPQYQYDYFDPDSHLTIQGYYSGWEYYTSFDIFNFGLSNIDIGGNTLRRYRREFDCYGEYDIDGDLYEDFYAYKWRVYQPTPIIVPYAFLEQFLLGLYLSVQGDIESFEGDMYVYNFNEHYFDRRYLSLRTESEFPGFMNSISPSSLRSIFNTNDDRYIFYQDKTAVNYDPLYYDRGWCMCRFDLRWITDGTENSTLAYSNANATEEIFDLMENAASSQLEYDILRIWNMTFGDVVYTEPINPPDIIFGTVEGFLATEFIPDFSFGDLLLIVLGVMVFGAFLKVFLGG